MGKSSLGKRKNSSVPVRVSALGDADNLPGQSTGNDQRGQRYVKRSHIPKPTTVKGRSSSSEREERQGACALPLTCSTSSSNLHNLGLETPITAMHGMPGTAQSIKSNLMLDAGYRTHSTKKMVRDLRPLSDRHFQNLALEKILSYFQQRSASSSVTSSNNNADLVNALKSRSLTLKVFVEMVSHLFSVFYKKHVINMTNYADEIPHLAKKIGYPGSVKKSWLITANSIHSWPNVIGLLSWLVDSVQCITPQTPGELMFPPQVVDRDLEEDSLSRILGSKRMCDYYLKCYNIYNKDEETAEEDMALEDAQLKQEMIKKLNIRYDDFAAEKEEIMRLEQQLNDSEEIQSQNEVKKLELILTNLQNDAKKLQTCLRKRESYCNALHQEIENLKATQEASMSTIKEHRAEIERASQLLDNQTLSVDDKKRIEAECRDMLEQNKLNKVFCDTLSKAIYSDDLKISKMKALSNDKCLQYNARFMEDAAAVPDYNNFLVNVNILHSDASTVLQDLDARLDQLLTELKTEANKMDSMLEEAELRVVNIEEQTALLKQDNEKYTSELEAKQNEIRKIKEKMKKNEGIHLQNMHMLQDKLASLSTDLPSITELEKELKSAQDHNELIQKEAKYVQERTERTMQNFEDMFQRVMARNLADLKELAELSKQLPNQRKNEKE